MNRFFQFTIRYRWIILVLMALVTVAAGAMISRGIVATTIGGMFLGEDPRYHRYLERVSEFGSSEAMIVVFEDEKILSAVSQARLIKAVNQIKKIPLIVSVRSVLDVQNIQSSEQELVISPYADLALKNPEAIKEIQQQLANDPLGGGLFISKDGKYSTVLVELDAEADIAAEQGPAIVNNVRKAFLESGYNEGNIHIVGMPATLAAVIQETNFNIQRLFPIVCLILFITVWIMFRRFWPVVLTLTVSFIAVIWTIGFSVLLDRHISVLTSMIPAVIMIIAFSDVVHLCSAYLLELGRGKSKKEAIFASGSDVGKACLLTSATTFFGFVAMSFVPAPAFRHLGIVLGVGVGVALLIAVTLVPIFFSFMREPKPWRIGSTGKVQDFLDRFLSASAGISNNHPWKVIIVFAIFITICIVGLTQLRIDTDFAERLDKDHPVQVDSRFFMEHFPGANLLDVFIETPEKDGLLDPELFKQIALYQDTLEKQPGVSRVFSLVDLVETMHRKLNEGDEQAGRLPKSREALAQYLLLFEMSGGEEMERLVDFSRTTMRMTMQMPEEAVRVTAVSGLKAKESAPALVNKKARVEVSGLMFLMGWWLDSILAGQRRGLGFAFLAISIMMMIGLRSIRVGLWSMLPNMLPLLALGAYMGIVYDTTDSDLLALAMIAIGIGVDDTIHFLMRFRIESQRQTDIKTAIERTFHFSGRGIVITTIILVAGFAPFILSDYLSLWFMGSLLPMTLIVALVADLFLAPALVRVGAIRFSNKNAD